MDTAIIEIRDRLNALQNDASRAFDVPIRAEITIRLGSMSVCIRPVDVVCRNPWIFGEGQTVDQCIHRVRVQFEKTLRERDEQQRLNDMTLGIVEAA
jgi:hypothetical protein